jgi:hypothetical protein
LRALVEELRTKQANLQRANVRKIQSLKAAEIPAEEAYKAAVTELATTPEGANLEAARCALRRLVGSIPVFQQDGKIYGRIGFNAAPLFRGSNPNFIERYGSGGRYELYSNYPLCSQAVVASTDTRDCAIPVR